VVVHNCNPCLGYIARPCPKKAIHGGVQHSGTYLPGIPTLLSLRQENGEFEASLGYTVRLSQKNKRKEKSIKVRCILSNSLLLLF
jgi:hypothetical protein